MNEWVYVMGRIFFHPTPLSYHLPSHVTNRELAYPTTSDLGIILLVWRIDSTKNMADAPVVECEHGPKTQQDAGKSFKASRQVRSCSTGVQSGRRCCCNHWDAIIWNISSGNAARGAVSCGCFCCHVLLTCTGTCTQRLHAPARQQTALVRRRRSTPSCSRSCVITRGRNSTGGMQKLPRHRVWLPMNLSGQ